MKFWAVVLSLLVTFSCSQIMASNVIVKGCVGPVCVGAKESALKQDFGEKIYDATVNREGDEYPALRVVFDDESSVMLELENGTVWAIRISDSKFTTAKGVGVGSTFSVIRQAYPNALFEFGEEDGGYISLFVKELNGFFSFDTSNVFLEPARGSGPRVLEEKNFYALKAKVIIIHDR